MGEPWFTTPLGCEVGVWPASTAYPDLDPPGVLLRLRMADPADGRSAEVVLPDERAAQLAGLLTETMACAEGRSHEWRRVARTLTWSETRNTAAGAEDWNRWRVVEVCDRCGNPRVLDEWTQDG